MLEPRALRIGNWITVMGSLPTQVTAYHLYMMETYVPVDPNEADYKEMTQPIELSEEWLSDKAGFKLIENPEIENVKLKYWAKDALLLFFNESAPFNTYLVGYGFTHEGKYYAATHRWISKVHELQNVYREYRGNELIFNHG